MNRNHEGEGKMIKLSNDVRAEMHRLAEQAGVRLHPTAKQAEEAAERARAAAISQKFGEAALLFKAETTPGSDWPSQGPTIRLCTGQRHVVGRKTIDYGVASDDVANTGNGEPPVLVRHDPLAQINPQPSDDGANAELRRSLAEAYLVALQRVSAVRLRQWEEALKAQETDAAKYQRQFETLVTQLDALSALNAPPPARRHGVKAPLAGLLTTVAEDHRLGRFKG